MMNGKYSILTPNGINGTAFTESNQHYQNGVLFKVGSPLKFFPNVF